MSDLRGRFLWYDNLTRDVDAAVAFYRAVVGWDTMQWTAMDVPYSMFAHGETAFAGLQQMPPDAQAPPNWMGHIGTPDVAATTARAEALGGKVFVRLMQIPTVGVMSVIQDPQGAMFSAYQPIDSQNAAFDRPHQIGDFCWHELATTDVDWALAFYGDLFGWVKKAAHDMGHMGTYQIFGLPDRDLGGVYLKPESMPGPANWLYYVDVTDLDAALARVRGNKGTVVLEPVQVAGGARIAVCQDPVGAFFALHCITH